MLTTSSSVTSMQWLHRGDGYFKRIWIQYRSGDRDWAGTGRYVNIGNWKDGRLVGIPQDLPVYRRDVTDAQIVFAIALVLNGTTGAPSEVKSND